MPRQLKLVARSWLLATVCALALACAEKLTLDSELGTQVAELKDTIKCRHLGNVRATVKSELYSVGKTGKIAADLLVTARNLATEVGADTVVADGGINDGKQNFRLYLCNTRQ